MKKTKFILSCAAALVLMGVAAPCTYAGATEVTTPVVSETQSIGDVAMPYKEIIKYVYKRTSDGKAYKRLYNFSTGTWIGDWIRIK